MPKDMKMGKKMSQDMNTPNKMPKMAPMDSMSMGVNASHSMATMKMAKPKGKM